jgi:predicted DNA-binding transcriptional regulator AlpA
VTFGIDAESIIDAMSDASDLIAQVVKLLDPLDENLVTVSVSPDQLANTQFVGLGEVSTIMGVSKQRIYQLAKRSDFPQPAFRLKATPVWRRADIHKFERQRHRA